MERSTLARRGAPVAVFAAVLAVLAVLAARQGSPAARPLEPLPLSAGGGGVNTAEGRTSAPGMAADAMYYGGEIVIPDRLLQGVPTEGPVHRVAAGDLSAERIGALARALGVVGVVREDADGWYVGEGERVLRVYRQPGSPWHLGPDKGRAIAEPVPAQAEPEPAPDETATPCDDCDEPVSAPATDTPCTEKCSEPGAPGCQPPAPGTEPAPNPACVAPEPAPEPTKPPQPTDAEARATAQRVFDAVGLADATITVNDAWSGKEVVAAPVVGGLPTVGFETRVTVELGGRVQYAYGHLGAAELKGDYPLLAPREAVDRTGHYGAPRAMGAPCDPQGGCPTPEPREATGLRLGLTFMTSYDAEQGGFLAPAWLLTFEGSDWAEPVLALPDRYLATPPPAHDTDAPPPPDTATDGGGNAGSTGGSTGSAPQP